MGVMSVDRITAVLPSFMSRWILDSHSALSNYRMYQAAIIIGSVTYVIYRRVTNPLRHLPTPPFWESNIIFNMVRIIQGRMHVKMTEWHQKYGPILRLDSFISFSDPEAYRTVYGTHRFRKSPDYDLFQFTGPDVFSTTDRDFHKKRKGILAPMYGVNALKVAEPMVERVGWKALVEYLDRAVVEGRVVNMMEAFSFMTLDVIGEMTFGKRFGVLKGTRHPILDWIPKNQQYVMMRYVFQGLGVLVPKPKEVNMFIEFTRDAIRTRKERGTMNDVMQILFDAVGEDGETLREDDLVAEMIVQIAAGSDTTSISLSWTLYYLMLHPDAAETLYQELAVVLPHIDLRELDYAKVQHLPYLEAVINESLRVRPAATGALPRIVPEGGYHLLGYDLPDGATIGSAIYVMHHDPAYFDDPEVFKPERWLATDQDKLARMKKAFVPFSTGPRACLGRHLAWMELKLTIAAIVRRFTFEYVPGRDMTDVDGVILKPRGGHVDVRVRQRTQ